MLTHSTTFISVYRDDRWMKIPLNLVVEGDLVGIIYQEKIPLRVKCIEAGKNKKTFYE